VRQEPRVDDGFPPDAVPVGTRMFRPVSAPDSQAGQSRVRGLSRAGGRRGARVLPVRQVVASENGAQGCNQWPIHSRVRCGEDAGVEKQLDSGSAVREGGADEERS